MAEPGVVGGYIDLFHLPDYPEYSRFLPCDPKAGLFLFAGVDGSNATDKDLFGDSPGDEGISSLSFGIIDDQGTDRSTVFGSEHDVVFQDSASYLSESLAQAISGFPSQTVGAKLESNGFWTDPGFHGWSIRKTGTPSTFDEYARIFYLALEGDTMIAKSGTFTLASNGSQTNVHSLGFQPDLVFIFGSSHAEGGTFSVGAMDGSNQWVTSCAASYLNTGPGIVRSYQSKSGSIMLCPTVANGFVGRPGPFEGTGTIDSNGFHVNPTTNPPSNVTFGYLAIQDPSGEFKVGFGNQSSGVSSLDNRPGGVFFATTWSSDTSAHEGGGISLGFLSDRAAYGAGTFREAKKEVAIFTQDAPGTTRWRSNSSIHSLIQTNIGGSILKFLDATITSTGFTTTPSDGSDKMGYVTMRGSFQEGCPNPLHLSRIRFRPWVDDGIDESNV